MCLVLWVISIFVLFSVRGHPEDLLFISLLSVLYVLSPKENKSSFFFFIVFLFMNFLGFTLGLRLLFIWKQVMPAVIKVMKEESSLVTLVKPQFEARRSQVRKLSSINLYSFLLEIIKYRRDIN